MYMIPMKSGLSAGFRVCREGILKHCDGLFHDTKGRERMGTSITKNEHGFTLLELMITAALLIVVVTGLFLAFLPQQKSYLVQERLSETQQNLRLAFGDLFRDLKNSGAAISGFNCDIVNKKARGGLLVYPDLVGASTTDNYTKGLFIINGGTSPKRVDTFTAIYADISNRTPLTVKTQMPALTSMTAGEFTFTVADATNFSVGNLIVASNYYLSSIFLITGKTGNVITAAFTGSGIKEINSIKYHKYLNDGNASDKNKEMPYLYIPFEAMQAYIAPLMVVRYEDSGSNTIIKTVVKYKTDFTPDTTTSTTLVDTSIIPLVKFNIGIANPVSGVIFHKVDAWRPTDAGATNFIMNDDGTSNYVNPYQIIAVRVSVMGKTETEMKDDGQSSEKGVLSAGTADYYLGNYALSSVLTNNRYRILVEDVDLKNNYKTGEEQEQYWRKTCESN